MHKNFIRRKSLMYKVKLWFYRLTLQDFIRDAKVALSFLVELVMCLLMFGLLFIAPAFLR